MNPLTARGVHRMFPGTLGGRSRVASPVEKRKTTPKRNCCPRLVGPLDWLDDAIAVGLIDGGNTFVVMAYDGTPHVRSYTLGLSLISDVEVVGAPDDLINPGATAVVVFDDAGRFFWWDANENGTGSNPTEYRLERWAISGGDYVLDTVLMTVDDTFNHQWQSVFNPFDGLLYYRETSNGDAGPLFSVDPDTGADVTLTAAFGVEVAYNYMQVTPDGAVWMFDESYGDGTGDMHRWLAGLTDHDGIAMFENPVNFFAWSANQLGILQPNLTVSRLSPAGAVSPAGCLTVDNPGGFGGVDNDIGPLVNGRTVVIPTTDLEVFVRDVNCR